MPLIRFDSATHSYWIGDRQLRSVSEVVSSLVPPFDKERISQYCAKRDGKTQEAILAEWKLAGEQARDRGELVHSYIGDVLGGDRLFSYSPDLPECKAFDSAWTMLRDKALASILAKEQIVGDETLGIAGRFDLLLSVCDEKGVTKTSRLFDWKTGKYKTDNRFERLLPPFDDVPNSEHSKASLQTSLYRLLLEKENPTAVYGDSQIVHLRNDGTYVVYRAIDFRERLAQWLI